MREGFIFYNSYLEAAKDMPPKDRLAFYDALIGYAIEGKEPTSITKVANIAFVLSKPQVDANNRRYENGKQGGRPKKTDGFENEKPMVSEKNLSEKPKYKEKDKEKEKDNDKEKECIMVADAPTHTQRFIKPTIDEIRSYCKERRNNVDAEKFFNWYEMKGWRVGKSPMKDWQAAVRTWEHRDSEKKYPSEDYRRRIEVPTMEDWENEQGTI